MDQHGLEIWKMRQRSRCPEEQDGSGAGQHHKSDAADAHDDDDQIERPMDSMGGDCLPARLSGGVAWAFVEKHPTESYDRQNESEHAYRHMSPWQVGLQFGASGICGRETEDEQRQDRRSRSPVKRNSELTVAVPITVP